jgi:hypothetical protein
MGPTDSIKLNAAIVLYTWAQEVGYVAVDARDSGEALAYFTGALGFQVIEDRYLDREKSRILVAPPGAQCTEIRACRQMHPIRHPTR